MDCILADRTVRSLAAMVLALLACGVFAPGRLEAGCATLDHYFDTEHLGRSFSALIVGDVATAQAGVADPWGPKSPPPCSGPSCSRNTAPPFAPVLAEKWHIEHGLPVAGSPRVPRFDGRLCALDTTQDKPAPLPSGMFRPPR